MCDRYSTNVTLLVNFLQRGDAGADLIDGRFASDGRFAQKSHAFFAGGALDFGRGAAVEDEFAEVEELIGVADRLLPCSQQIRTRRRARMELSAETKPLRETPFRVRVRRMGSAI